MVSHSDMPWWAREFKEALKGYGLAVVIVLAGVTWLWTHGGKLVDAKATADANQAIVTAQLAKDWKEFQSQVQGEHREAAYVLQKISVAMDQIVNELRELRCEQKKNAPASPTSTGDES